MSQRLERFATVDAVDAGMRVDRFIADRMRPFSRSQLHQRRVVIFINDREVKASRKVAEADRVRVTYEPFIEPSLEPEAVELSILYEDDDVIVIDKPQGMVVHPGAGNWTGTLAHGLLYHVDSLEHEPGSLRPGIVHRLDKDTSGIIIAAKTAESQEYLAAQFRERTLSKTYLAIVKGSPRASRGRIETRIVRDPANRKRFTTAEAGGREAATEYAVRSRYQGYTLVTFHPVTGRTHQIRVHARHIGCPILGDPVYGRRDVRFPEATLMLHALTLTVRLPATGRERTFEAAVPARFRQVLQILEGLPSGDSASR